MKTMKRLLMVALAGFVVFAACDTGDSNSGNGSQTTEIQREFTVQMLGKDIAVKDLRSGENDQSLEALGLIAKLQDAFDENAIMVQDAEEFVQAVYDTILSRGVVIEVQESGDSFDGFKTKADGKTMVAHINYLKNVTASKLSNPAIINAVSDLSTGKVTAE